MPKRVPGRRRRRSPLFWPLAVILIFALAVFGVFSLFSVTEIKVEGTELYSYEEVVAASEIELGDNLFFVNRSEASSRIFSGLPYVGGVDVSRKFPGTVIITVTETGVVAYAEQDGDFWTMDQNCKVLDRVSSVSGLIRLTGLTPASPVQGERLVPESGGTAKTDLAAAVLAQVVGRRLTDKITEIDVSGSSGALLRYENRFEVRIGGVGEALSARFDRLQSAVSQLGASDSGILDLTIDEKVHYTPD